MFFYSFLLQYYVLIFLFFLFCFFLLYYEFYNFFYKNITYISPEFVKFLCNSGEGIIFDFRKKQYFKENFVANSVAVDITNIDSTRFIKYKNKCVIIICGTGVSEQRLFLFLKSKGFFNICFLKYSIEGTYF